MADGIPNPLRHASCRRNRSQVANLRSACLPDCGSVVATRTAFFFTMVKWKAIEKALRPARPDRQHDSGAVGVGALCTSWMII